MLKSPWLAAAALSVLGTTGQCGKASKDTDPAAGPMATAMKPAMAPDEEPDDPDEARPGPAGNKPDMAKPKKRAGEKLKKIVREKIKDLRKSGNFMGFGKPRKGQGLSGPRPGSYKPPSGQVRVGGVTVSGAGLNTGIVRRIVRQHQSEVRYCYATRGLTRNPKLKGQVTIAFVITSSGRVGRTSVRRTTLNHSATQACIRAAVRRWRFPRPSSKMAMAFATFLLKP